MRRIVLALFVFASLLTAQPSGANGTTKLVINEVDYDGPNDFVELKNVGSTTIGGLRVDYIDGATGSFYFAAQVIGTSIAPGDYYVFCQTSAAGCDLALGVDIEAGSPDAVRVCDTDAPFPDPCNTIWDTVSYEGDSVGAVEGSGAGLSESSATDGISRCPDGFDSDQNNLDFVTRGITMGAENCFADLSVSKSDSADPVVAGNQLTYTVTVDNAGPDAADNVVVTDTLPAGVSNPVTSGCAEDPGGAPTCSLGTIAAGGSAQYTITVDVDLTTNGTITNSASVSSSTTDPDSSDDSTTEDTLVEQYDFGDAPDPLVATAGEYPTLIANGGARHKLPATPTLFLGATVDPDADGQPNATATGDDGDAQGDDEDGVVFTSALAPGQLASVTVTASAPGTLNAWLDGNVDGDWVDAGEQIFTDVALAAGANDLTFTMPTGAAGDVTSFARFRFSSDTGLTPTGAASDGEVEDYAVQVLECDIQASSSAYGTSASEVICGSDGNDRIYGRGGNDIILTGDGDDRVYGGDGNDTIYTFGGSDRAYGEDGNDTIFLGPGNDWGYGGDGDDTIDGEEGDDKLYGEKDADTLTGGPDDDDCYGGPGADTLDGSCESASP